MLLPEEFGSSGSGQPASPSTTDVADLKSLIQKTLSIPYSDEISLVLDDTVLQDEKTLVDSGVVDGTVLSIVVRKRSFLAKRRNAIVGIDFPERKAAYVSGQW